jgi:cysteine-rich repeat protein
MRRRTLVLAALLAAALPLRAAAVCGNGVLEAGEECDDGNTIGGDGCSASCLQPWAVVVAGQSNAEQRSTVYQDQSTARVVSPDPATGLVSRMFRTRYLFEQNPPEALWVQTNAWPCAESECTAKPGKTCMGRTAATHVSFDPSCTCHCGTKDADLGDERTSAWPTFAQRIMRDAGREVEIVMVALGSTSLVAPDGDPPGEPLWDPNVDCSNRSWTGDTAWIDERGDLYCLLFHAVAQAQVGARLKAVLWYQGEDDASWLGLHGAPTRTQYAAALEALADGVWTQLGVPLIVAPISLRSFPGDPAPSAGPGDATDQIHDAALDAIAADPHIRRGPTTDDLEHEDSVHIRNVVTLGERWANALRTVLAGQEYDGIEAGPDPTPCGNGIDDDGDGLIDATDPGCANAYDLSERSAALPCDDGVDNDGDGRVDWPADADCGSPSGLSESPDPNACRNGIDDDGDGLVDLEDPGCASAADDSEKSAAIPCDNGIDDDGDGRVDFRVDGTGDPGCHDPTASSQESPQCQNGIDDDGDGKVDFDGGASARFGVPIAAPDPQCNFPDRNREAAASCGLGAELALAIGLVVRRSRAPRSGRATSPRSR